MDRRRWILVVFIVALVVASMDVYSNRVRIFDDWAENFEVRWEDPTMLPHVIESHASTHDADGVEAFVVKQGFGNVNVRGAATDEITVEAEIRTLLTREANERVDLSSPRVIRIDGTQGIDGTHGNDGAPGIDGADGSAEPDAAWFRLDVERTDGALTVRLIPNSPEVADIRIMRTELNVTVPADMAVDVTASGGVVIIRDMRGAQRVHGVNSTVQLSPAAAGPIDVSLDLGELRLFIPRHAANHSVRADLNPGSIRVVNATLQQQRTPARVIATGTLGDGAFPMDVRVDGGYVALNVLD